MIANTTSTRNVMNVLKGFKNNKTPYIILNNSKPSAVIFPYSEDIISYLINKYPDVDKIGSEMKKYYMSNNKESKEWEEIDIDFNL